MSQRVEPAAGVTRLRLGIAYDGRDFHGWGRQPEHAGLRTVQGEMERVLGFLFHSPDVEVTCAGRTDAGVHASGQVAHADVSAWPADVDVRRVNRALPDDIRVTSIAHAPAGFDARFSAIWRRYEYRVCDDPAGPDPLERHRTLFFPRPLDLDAMNEAAKALHGEHDFAAFCKPRDFATTVRAILDLEWRRDADGVAVMDIRADAFCHSMVRSVVGVLLPVGEGRKPVAWPGEVLAAAERSSGVTVMPPHPLTLVAVGYPPDDEMAARASETRRLRQLGDAVLPD